MFMSTAAATDRAVDERRDVAALAVQHHQGLIRVKAAQRHRAGDVRTAVIDGCEKLHEGTNRLSVLFSSPLPDPCNALSKMTSIGTGLSETVRLATQLPITTIWLPASASGATCASAAVSELGADWIVCAAAGIPSASTEAESDRLAASLPYVMNIPCSERLPTVLIGRHRMTSPSSSKATTAAPGICRHSVAARPHRTARGMMGNQHARQPAPNCKPTDGIFQIFQNGAAYRTRTCDPRITNAMLYQLS